MNITKEDTDFCLRLENECLEKAAEMEEKAKSCKPNQRGAYLSNAKQYKKSAARMRANYDAQMGWLVEHNFELYLELKGE